MKGFPKFQVGDRVKFMNNSDITDPFGNIIVRAGVIEGEILIVDRYGAIGCDDVSYDIFQEERNMLWKHVEEGAVLRKIENPEKEVC